jgi:outer membrane immunogenic protein
MKVFFLGGIAFAAILGGPALAADIPGRAPVMKAPVMAPQYNWSGCYIGANVGAAKNNSDLLASPSGSLLLPPAAANNPLRTDSFSFEDTAFTGGGQVGCNWQSGSWVFGIEGDLQWSGLDETILLTRPLAAPLLGNISYNVNHQVDWWGTARGRLGMAWNNVLLYGTGGLAYGRVQSSARTVFSLTGETYAGAASDTSVGWTAGAGVEWGFAPNWSVKAEYLYVDLGSFSYLMPNVPPPAFPAISYTADVSTKFHVGRVGVNFRF